MKRLIGISLAAAVLAMVGVNTAQATIMIQPIGVTYNGTYNHGYDGIPDHIIDGTGLSNPSLVAQGASVPGTMPTHAGWDSPGNTWVGGMNGTEVFTLDLGATYDLSSIDFWNFGPALGQNYWLTAFTVSSSATVGGTYANVSTFNPVTPAVPNPTVSAENFAYSATGVQFVKLSSFAAANFASMSEIRFEGVVAAGDGNNVPEPSTWLLLGGSLLGLCVGGFKRIRSKLSA